MSSTFSNLTPSEIDLPSVKVNMPEIPSVITKPPSSSGSWSNALILFFCVFTVVWVVLYTFNPQIIRSQFSVNDSNGNTMFLPDKSRLFVASLVLALLIELIVWMFCSTKY